MGTVSALDVADYIVKKSAPMSAMKLQKLVYYSQAWSLAWDSELLFHEEIQAWANGPVVYELFGKHRGRFTIADDFVTGGDQDRLSLRQKEITRRVVDSYKGISSAQLSAMTHAEYPWQEARQGYTPTERCSVAIDPETMLQYYSGLLNDKRAVDVADLATSN